MKIRLVPNRPHRSYAAILWQQTNVCSLNTRTHSSTYAIISVQLRSRTNEKQKYISSSSWYQLEWAKQLVTTLSDILRKPENRILSLVFSTFTCWIFINYRLTRRNWLWVRRDSRRCLPFFCYWNTHAFLNGLFCLVIDLLLMIHTSHIICRSWNKSWTKNNWRVCGFTWASEQLCCYSIYYLFSCCPWFLSYRVFRVWVWVGIHQFHS
jgi:hypothetical protein